MQANYCKLYKAQVSLRNSRLCTTKREASHRHLQAQQIRASCKFSQAIYFFVIRSRIIPLPPPPSPSAPLTTTASLFLSLPLIGLFSFTVIMKITAALDLHASPLKLIVPQIIRTGTGKHTCRLVFTYT